MQLQTMNPTIIAGDIHGNILAMSSIISEAKDIKANLIFVGDYLDSWPHSREDQKKCLDLILEYKDHPDIYFMRGNHELAYQDPRSWWCSGHNFGFQEEIEEDLAKINFIDYIWIDNLLITHAGLSLQYLESQGFKEGLDTLSDPSLQAALSTFMDTQLEDTDSDIYLAGRPSGGRNKAGGIFWSRPFNFKTPSSRIIQIFGHTQHSQIEFYAQEYSFCIDCLEQADEEFPVLYYTPYDKKIIQKTITPT